MYICDECVDLCNDIICEEIKDVLLKKELVVLLMLRKICEYFDDYVIG